MSARVSVGSTYWDRLFWIALGLGAAGMTLAVCLWVTNWAIGVVLFWLAVSVIPLVMAGIRLAQLISRRYWLEETPTGFRLTTSRGVHDLTPDDVLELGTHLRDVREGAKTDDPLERMMRLPPTHRQRVITLQLLPSPFRKPIKLIYRWPLGATDPFEGLFERLADGMAERAARTVRGGGQLAGRGWYLTPSALIIDEKEFEIVKPVSVNGPVRRSIQLAHLLAARTLDNALVIEIRTTGAPMERSFGPVRGANGGVLQRALAKLVADILAGEYHPPAMEDIAVEEGSPLGRLVFASILTHDLEQLRVFSDGVEGHTQSGVTSIPFDELREFTYAGVRNVTLIQRDTLGFTATLKFTAVDGREVRHSEYVGTDSNPELDNIRDLVGRRMATMMKRLLDAGHSVRWTDRITFEPDGVSVAVSGKSDEDLLLDWDDVRLVNTKPGQFALYSRSTGRKVKELASLDTNFFPGFFLLEEMRPTG